VDYSAGAVESLWSIDQYFEFVLVLMLSTGLAFQVSAVGLLQREGIKMRCRSVLGRTVLGKGRARGKHGSGRAIDLLSHQTAIRKACRGYLIVLLSHALPPGPRAHTFPLCLPALSLLPRCRSSRSCWAS
jgi:hypothetical protein